jgi:hypothetical protein
MRAVAAPSNRDADEADWVSIFIGSRTGDTRNGNRKFGRGAFERAFRHRACNFLAHRTFGPQELFRHAQSQGLVAFGVSDESPLQQLSSTRREARSPDVQDSAVTMESFRIFATASTALAASTSAGLKAMNNSQDDVVRKSGARAPFAVKAGAFGTFKSKRMLKWKSNGD